MVCQMELTSHLLTSMTDAMRFPGGEMADLYSHRWEIELGYREIKQTMQLSRLTLRSKSRSLWSKSCGCLTGL
ncbi:transposase insG [Escherichia coli]|nr:transposase insG [Escherichia coli]